MRLADAKLLSNVLDAGVVGGCADVCGILENKTHSEIAGVACNLLCDYVGIKTFIDLIEKWVVQDLCWSF